MSDKEYLKRLVKADIGNWEDNLHRAKWAQANTRDPSKKYGSCSQSLNEMVADYESLLAKSKKALADLEKQP